MTYAPSKQKKAAEAAVALRVGNKTAIIFAWRWRSGGN